MTALTNGEYRTAAGSAVEITGNRTNITLDWFEEDHACLECVPQGVADGFLVWSCDRCGGGRAKLEPVEMKISQINPLTPPM